MYVVSSSHSKVVHLRFAPLIFFCPGRIWSKLHISSEYSKTNLTLALSVTLNLLFFTIKFVFYHDFHGVIISTIYFL